MWPQIPFVALMIAFGHSLLAMSGFETLAQVYREIASPKLKNLKITANIVCTYAVFSTGVVTMFAVMIIPDDLRKNYVRQPDRRSGDEPRRALPAAARLPRLRGDRGRADPFRRRQHIHHRGQRRAEPRGGGRRAAGLVPQAPPPLRHDLPHHQPRSRSCNCSPSSPAAATSTCSARPTPSAWSGVSS